MHVNKLQSHKMFKHTQTICQQIADKLFECVWLFCGVGAWRVNGDVSFFFITFDNMPNINPFQPEDPFLYPLKTSENQTFSDAFKGV